MTSKRIFVVLVISIFFSGIASAQLPFEMTAKVPYYIDVNTADQLKVYEMRNGILSLQYQDQIGYSKTVALQFFNWKKELLGFFSLEKEFGLNHFSVDLTTLSIDETQTYSCLLTDENGKKYEWYVKPVTKNFVPVTVNIVANPLYLTCKTGDQSLVQFYGVVSEGRPPYTLHWYIMNESQTDFLYQPKEEEVKTAGQSSVVEVDKDPAYYVVLDVTDACGATSRKMIYMQCDVKKRGKNTLVVQPLDKFPEIINKYR
ncbi:MAG TPA: hypothetical protein VL443_26245 [Cyclobacteriaceae bacterium]|jgi:hypothetical protein|nr:hypothetical protein [Cyclobacteriaceae bacterium]